MTDEVIENNNDILERIYQYRREALYRKSCHYYMSNKAQNRANGFGFCVTVLSTIVGTATFSAIFNSNGGKDPGTNIIGWITCLISVTAAVFSSLQTFLGFAGTAEKNKKSALEYEIIYNKIESIFLNYRLFEGKLNANTRTEILIRIKETLSDFEKASASAPNIPDNISKKFDDILNPKP